MILGIGSDLVDIRRIERTVERHGERFLGRIFTETERARAERRANRVETYAKRFAAKEACAKALGTGFRRGVFWRDMGVVNLPAGRQAVRPCGSRAEPCAACRRSRRRAARLGSTSPSRTRGPWRRRWWSFRPCRGSRPIPARREIQGERLTAWGAAFCRPAPIRQDF